MTRYLGNELSFEEFEDWLFRPLGKLRAASLMAINLVNEVELRIAEFTSRHLTGDS